MSQEDSRRSRLLSVLLTGSLAPGHLQTQLEAAARTLLPGRVLHLLRIEGSERRALASPPRPRPRPRHHGRGRRSAHMALLS